MLSNLKGYFYKDRHFIRAVFLIEMKCGKFFRGYADIVAPCPRPKSVRTEKARPEIGADGKAGELGADGGAVEHIRNQAKHQEQGRNRDEHDRQGHGEAAVNEAPGEAPGEVAVVLQHAPQVRRGSEQREQEAPGQRGRGVPATGDRERQDQGLTVGPDDRRDLRHGAGGQQPGKPEQAERGRGGEPAVQGEPQAAVHWPAADADPLRTDADRHVLRLDGRAVRAESQDRDLAGLGDRDFDVLIADQKKSGKNISFPFIRRRPNIRLRDVRAKRPNVSCWHGKPPPSTHGDKHPNKKARLLSGLN